MGSKLFFSNNSVKVSQEKWDKIFGKDGTKEPQFCGRCLETHTEKRDCGGEEIQIPVLGNFRTPDAPRYRVDLSRKP